MNENIINYIEQQTCASLCCITDTGKPYCFSCYYVFNKAEGLLYYKSSADSTHSVMMKLNPAIAGTILPDKLSKVTVKGIQFEGIALAQDHPLCQQSSSIFYKKNPMAMALGFGKKLLWHCD
jgi:uncharacterized protein YhbP (UPF0306 family)